MATQLINIESDLYRTINLISYKPKVDVRNFSRAKLEADLLGQLTNLVDSHVCWGNIDGNLGDQTDLVDYITNIVTPIENDVAVLKANIYEVTYKETIDLSSTTTGSISFPTGATLDEAEFPGNAVLSTRTGTQIDYETPLVGSTPVTVNIDNAGNYTASQIYSGDVYLVFRLRISASNYNNLDNGKIIEFYLSENSLDNNLDNRIIVTQANFATTLGGTIDSTKEYFLDGIIDTGSTSITIPSTGINISGYNFDLSGLVSSEDNYTMFVSDVGGSGNVLGKDYKIEVTGTNSQVYDLTDANGFNAFEFARINFINCTSLGEISGYRQGLENGTGRFGASPSLTLSGTWLGGYRVVTSIVRNMSGTTAQPLFKAGTGFTMNSRFATDANIDLGTLQPLLDFAPSNFVNPSTLQLQEMILTRGGVSDPTDTNITPNIESSDLVCNWKRNVGLNNTYVGGTISLISEATTAITFNTWTAFSGTFLGTGLQHFSANASGELTHNGTSPREFEFTGNLVVEGGANDSLSVRFNKWDNSASAFTPLDYTIQTRTVNSLVGGRDVAIFNLDIGGELDQGDYLFLEVRNNTDGTNVTLESSSYFRVQER